jgi:S-DNA-T family DNA segregation ATPase FtsK/SpoIIIE
VKISLAEIGQPTRSDGRTLLGVGGDAAEPVVVDLKAGDGRFLITGPARSGRTSTLIVIADQLHVAGRRALVAAPTRSRLAGWARQRGLDLITPNEDLAVPASDVDTVLIDDSEQFVDTAAGDLLARWLVAADSGTTTVCVARSEDLMVSFRGVAVDVRRSRTGLLLQPTVADGELLGVRVPPQRTSTVPGRGLLVSDEYRSAAPNGLPIQVAAMAD